MSGDIAKAAVMSLISPWKDFGTILKGELKRTIINVNLALELTLGPTLAGADYAERMRQHKEKIDVIDKDVKGALDKLPMGAGATTMLWAVAPGAMLFNSAREVSGKVTPDSVENFMDEYGFKNLTIARFPVGKFMTFAAKKAATVGGFATLNQQAVLRSTKELEDKAEPKWYTPIERMLLLQLPTGPSFRKNENNTKGSGLLLEAEEEDTSQKDFENFLRMSGFEQNFTEKVGAPYVEAQDNFITGLVDIFEKDILETTAIATAATFDDFTEALQKSTLKKFDKINVPNIKKDMETTVNDLVADEEKIKKFLKVVNKKPEDFNNEEDLKKFVLQKLYEKEFSQVRANSIQSIETAVEEITIEILQGLEEKDLEDLRINPLGEELYSIIKSALDRLKRARQEIDNVAKEAEKVTSG